MVRPCLVMATFLLCGRLRLIIAPLADIDLVYFDEADLSEEVKRASVTNFLICRYGSMPRTRYGFISSMR